MKIRKAVHSGSFYPSHKKDLIKLYESILLSEKHKITYTLANQELIGAIVPHAGFMYSGYQAIHFFEILKNNKKKFETIFIINPNHTGYGPDIAIDENQAWQTNMGTVLLDEDFISILDFPLSAIAHRFEHSGEIMLPFLKHVLHYDFTIVPITLSKQNHKNALHIARAIFEANKKLQKQILLIASSDFSHYLSPEKGYELDEYVVEKIKKLDATAVEQEIKAKNISVCGYGPIMTLIEYACLVSTAPKVQLLRRGHSGEVHPSPEVVDYISFLFYQ